MTRKASLRRRLNALAVESFDFWTSNGPDATHGGFHGKLDRFGKPLGAADKGLVQQTRHLWTMSMWYARRERSPKVKALADDLYAFISRHFYDPASGEFHFMVSAGGTAVETKKVLYGQSFAIYALSEYARSFQVAAASELALACFRALDARAHDAAQGGYDQRQERAWLTPGAHKETNTHIHLLEAFTTLYEVTRDETVRQRLHELLAIVGAKILQPEDYAHPDFTADWSPLGAPRTSYGHDLETAWLMLEAARALGRPDDSTVREQARRMAAHAAREGYDAERGGYFEEGPVHGAATKREKLWWVQAEALPGLLRLFELTGDIAALDRLEGTLGWIERHQRDHEGGEWFWGILPNGQLGERGAVKGEEWKASYHTVRSLVFTEAWLR